MSWRKAKVHLLVSNMGHAPSACVHLLVADMELAPAGVYAPVGD